MSDKYKIRDLDNAYFVTRKARIANPRQRGQLRNNQYTEDGLKLSEVDAINIENISRYYTGDKRRTSHSGIEIPNSLLSPIGKRKSDNNNVHSKPIGGSVYPPF